MNYKKIKDLLTEKGTTFTQLSEKIGMSRRGLYASIEKESLTISSLEKIAAALDVPIITFYEDQPGGITSVKDFDIQKQENDNFKKRIKELEEQLEDKRRLLNYQEAKMNSVVDHLSQAKRDQYDVSELWEYYLDEADKEYPLFRQLLLTPLSSRNENYDKEYKKAKKIRGALFTKKLLDDPTIKKQVEAGKSIKDLMKIFIDF